MMRKRFAALASIAVVGWLLAFASHIHLPDERPAGKPAPPHPCLFCAAFQTGAGSTVFPAVVAPENPQWQAPREYSSHYSPAFIAAYRSRAPPVA